MHRDAKSARLSGRDGAGPAEQHIPRSVMSDSTARASSVHSAREGSPRTSGGGDCIAPPADERIDEIRGGSMGEETEEEEEDERGAKCAGRPRHRRRALRAGLNSKYDVIIV